LTGIVVLGMVLFENWIAVQRKSNAVFLDEIEGVKKWHIIEPRILCAR